MRSREIEHLVKTGTKIRVSFGTVYIHIPSETGISRVACVAGKKAHRLAVIRHAIQRRLRAAVKSLPSSSSIPSYEMVIVASSVKVREMEFQDIIGELHHGLTSVYAK
jgi:ribonuclease P protein component